MRWTPEVVITLVVRAAGLVLAVLFLRRAISAALNLCLVVLPQAGSFGLTSLVDSLVSAAWTIGLVGAGVYCFLSGRWLIERLLAGVGPGGDHCKSCGYDISGIERGKRCPECGAVRW